ncbi:hypothetical protein AOLI_G00077650 [Acnodon oligacanthus]
MGMRQSS